MSYEGGETQVTASQSSVSYEGSETQVTASQSSVSYEDGETQVTASHNQVHHTKAVKHKSLYNTIKRVI